MRATQISAYYIQLDFFKKSAKNARKATFATSGDRTHTRTQNFEPLKKQISFTIGDSCFFARVSCFGTRPTRATRVRLADRCALPQARRRDRAGLEP